MKSVLISIRPEWCEKIASGKKTIEVRKTRPRCETPFKVYIYCTADDDNIKGLLTKSNNTGKIYTTLKKYCQALVRAGNKTLNRKVIGEFICDNIDNHSLSELIVKEDRELALLSTCLTRDEVLDYLGYERGTSIYDCKNFDFYGWHISDLEIYDEPKRLSEFSNASSRLTPNPNTEDGFPFVWSGMTRPPQSWCYVEEA